MGKKNELEIIDSGPITEKQLKFVEEYLIDCNATQAAIRAGYSKRTANEQGCRLLANVSVAKVLKERQDKRSDAVEIDGNWVLRRFKEINDRCMQAVPVMVFDASQNRMVQLTEENEAGEEVGVWQFDSTGANRSLQMIAKHLGWFEIDNKQKANTRPMDFSKLSVDELKILNDLRKKLIGTG